MRRLAMAVVTIAALHANAVVPPPEPCTSNTCWFPPLATRWQYQLQGRPTLAATGGINLDISAVPPNGGTAVRPDVFDIDLYVDAAVTGNNDTLATSTVTRIHTGGGKAVCYVSAGTFEPWRPDAGAFPGSVQGRKVGGFNEKWLDIRQLALLLPIMEARVQRCRQAGFDAVEWDNVDGYANRTGFPLTAQHQLEYNTRLANLAHAYGLTVGLKNDVGQVVQLEPYFDFAVNEECARYRECDTLIPFRTANKAVFEVEYKRQGNICSAANSANRNAIIKTVDLFDTPWGVCR